MLSYIIILSFIVNTMAAPIISKNTNNGSLLITILLLFLIFLFLIVIKYNTNKNK